MEMNPAFYKNIAGTLMMEYLLAMKFQNKLKPL
jgi:hypothetical protein